nr:MAG: coat protein [brine shrimp noda-like virus 3]
MRRNRSTIGQQMYAPVTSAPHGVGTRITIPGPRRINNTNGDLTLSGRDFLGTLTVKKTVDAVNPVAHSVLASWDISPQAFKQTRLEYLSRIYEMYKFTKVAFEYEPAVPTTLGCQLIAYGDTDPKDDPKQAGTKEELVRIAASHAGARQFNFIQRQSIPMVTKGINKFYFTGGNRDENPRFTTQGKFHIIQVSDPIDLNGAPIESLQAGAVYINWTCTFKVPQIEVSPSTFRSTSGYRLFKLDGPRDFTIVNTTSAPLFYRAGGNFYGAPFLTTPVTFGAIEIEYTGEGQIPDRVDLRVTDTGIRELAPGQTARIFYTTLADPATSTYSIEYIAIEPIKSITVSESSKQMLRDLVVKHTRVNERIPNTPYASIDDGLANSGPYGKPITDPPLTYDAPCAYNNLGLYPTSTDDSLEISDGLNSFRLGVDMDPPEL